MGQGDGAPRIQKALLRHTVQQDLHNMLARPWDYGGSNLFGSVSMGSTTGFRKRSTGLLDSRVFLSSIRVTLRPHLLHPSEPSHIIGETPGEFIRYLPFHHLSR